MTQSAARPSQAQVALGTLAVVSGMISLNLGAAFAKRLFPLVGALGVTSLRVGLAAVLLLLLFRPRPSRVTRRHLPALALYGLTLGTMNILVYQAFARLPVGIAIGIEIIGPLSVVLLTSRRARDFAWLALAVVGLLLLLPLRPGSPLDPVGVGFALGAAVAWALYIVTGKRVSAPLGHDALAWGMLIAALLATPLGVVDAGAALLQPAILLGGLIVAALSSALPYALEISAMRRLPTRVFGILLSASPAVAAVAGWLVLGETLSLVQGLAIACIMLATAGAVVTAGQKRPPPR